MSFVAAAVGVGAVTGLAGSAMQASAAGSAADKQSAAAREANDLQYRMFQQQQQANEPFRQAGVGALYGSGGMFRRRDGGSGMATSTANHDKYIQDQLDQAHQSLSGVPEWARAQMGSQFNDDVIRSNAENQWKQSGQSNGVDSSAYELDPELTRKFSMADYQEDPGYQFRLQQGQKALERSAAARGGLSNGGTIRGLSDYAQGSASQEYQNAYNRFNNDQSNRFNRLASLSGMGQTANAAMGSAGQNYANQVGQNSMGAANAQGAAGMAQAGAWGNALSGIGNSAMQLGMMKGGGFGSIPSSGGAGSGSMFGSGGWNSSLGQIGGPTPVA